METSPNRDTRNATYETSSKAIDVCCAEISVIHRIRKLYNGDQHCIMVNFKRRDILEEFRLRCLPLIRVEADYTASIHDENNHLLYQYDVEKAFETPLCMHMIPYDVVKKFQSTFIVKINMYYLRREK